MALAKSLACFDGMHGGCLFPPELGLRTGCLCVCHMPVPHVENGIVSYQEVANPRGAGLLTCDTSQCRVKTFTPARDGSYTRCPGCYAEGSH